MFHELDNVLFRAFVMFYSEPSKNKKWHNVLFRASKSDSTSIRRGDRIDHEDGTYSTISGSVITNPDGSECNIIDEDTYDC